MYLNIIETEEILQLWGERNLDVHVVRAQEIEYVSILKSLRGGV